MAISALPQRIVILGTGGNSIDILDTINDINALGPQPRFECIGFLEDSESRWGELIAGVPVLGPLGIAREITNAAFVNGIGSDRNFWKKDGIIARTGLDIDRFVSIVHPTASVSKMSHLGRGVVVLQHVTIASNVTIGDHVIILPNSVISHDGIVGDYTAIAGGVTVSGNVTIGQSCYLGTNSAIISNVTIGSGALIGMGSVVLRNVSDNTVVVGNPARFLRNSPARCTPTVLPAYD